MISSGVKLGPIPGIYNVKLVSTLAIIAEPTKDPQIYRYVHHL